MHSSRRWHDAARRDARFRLFSSCRSVTAAVVVAALASEWGGLRARSGSAALAARAAAARGAAGRSVAASCSWWRSRAHVSLEGYAHGVADAAPRATL